MNKERKKDLKKKVSYSGGPIDEVDREGRDSAKTQ